MHNPKLDPHFVSVFVQDEFRLSPSVIINAGLQYEAMLFPEPDPNAPYALSRKIDNDLKDFAPRVALNWRVTKDGKTVLRAAYGLFYDVPSLSIFYTAAQVNGDRFLSYLVPGTDPSAPKFRNIPSAGLSTQIVPPSINAFAPGYHNTYQQQANLQIQRELAWRSVMTIAITTPRSVTVYILKISTWVVPQALWRTEDRYSVAPTSIRLSTRSTLLNRAATRTITPSSSDLRRASVTGCSLVRRGHGPTRWQARWVKEARRKTRPTLGAITEMPTTYAIMSWAKLYTSLT